MWLMMSKLLLIDLLKDFQTCMQAQCLVSFGVRGAPEAEAATCLTLHVCIALYFVAGVASVMRSIVFSRWSSDLSDDQA